MEKATIVECPRDAMQGFKTIIPTETKVKYLNLLLQVGFDIIDIGSFVSPKAVPQMADTPEVLESLNLENTKSELLVIVANYKHSQRAVPFSQVKYWGYSFGISETFMNRNLRTTREEGLKEVERILSLAENNGYTLVVYLSMAFGNPYGDPWSPEEVFHWAHKIYELGVTHQVLADTTAMATPETISLLCKLFPTEVPVKHWGIHLHTTPTNWKENVCSAWDSGCRRFDSALGGYGGCPFAADELVSNLPTENLLEFLREKDALPDLNWEALKQAREMLPSVFMENTNFSVH